MTKVKIIAKLETSDHDEYCSGEECEYKVKIVSHVIELPDKYKNYPTGKLNILDENDWINY